MSHVFISYSRNPQDSHFVSILTAWYLKPNNISYWRDIEHIPAGSRWDDEVHQALRSASQLIVVMSPESMESDEVHNEWAFALARKMRVIPIYYRTCEIHYRLESLNYIDFRIDTKKASVQLVEALSKPYPKEIEQSVISREALEKELESPNWHIRLDALDTLMKMSAGAGVLAIIQTLTNDPQSLIRERVKQGRRQLGVRISQTPSDVLLPPPFAWIDIPAGRVTLEERRGFYGGGQTFDVPAFAIAKYPITNAQFAKFIEAGGYNNQAWWTDAGWRQRQMAGWTQPRYWGESERNGAEQPVVGVSWYEAIAFCLWLSEASSEAIMLPTEQQWQRAAQGNDGRTYPWGNKWDRNRCNNSVDKKGIGKTTPVTQYEGKGDSPYGVVDMSGNVWEWTSSVVANYPYDADDGREDDQGDSTDVPVLRGGSFSSTAGSLRAADRFGGLPLGGYLDLGFRCVRSSG